MLHATPRSVRVLITLSLAVTIFLTGALCAQTSRVASRITAAIDDSSLVTVKGSVHPLTRAASDLGVAPDSMSLERIHLFLKRSAAQEAALQQRISDMHAAGSAVYHQWLTPEQFGAEFGPSDQDLATVQSWLLSHGFQGIEVKPGRQVIEFAGTVAQMRAAFHTSIHRYQLHGETHYANAGDPRIPAALAPVIGGFASLNNFRVKSHRHQLGTALYDPQTHQTASQWTYGSNASFSMPLVPADFAVQYNLNPLYSAGTTGSGQSIAVINDSNVNVAFVNQFRSLFGLSANPPVVIVDGNDPGVDGINNPDGPNYDSVEAYLDVEWSGAVAPAATIDLVVSADTALESGLILAAEHAVYANLAPVMSLSFGYCESGLGSSNDFLSALWEQAAAQGITVVVSTGDSGSAGCDNPNSQDYAVSGLAVNGFASTPYNVAVGGTDFYYSNYANSSALATQLANYWNLTPSQLPQSSILQVIPEQPWNDSQYGSNAFDYYDNYGSTLIVGGGGGVSDSALCSTSYDSSGTCTGTLSGYSKPAWQSGTGVPADGVRDLPDVSLFAADGINYSYYAMCAVDGDCQTPTGSNLVQFSGVGGTSASVQVFAGMMALINQKYGRQGQANFVLYPLKAQYPAAFHDITHGNIAEPCAYTPLSPDCISVSNPLTVSDPTYGTAVEGVLGSGGAMAYSAAAGYNLATGLGTIDANVLVTDWNKVSLGATSTTLTPSSTSFAHGAAITISGLVTGTGTPTGNVALMTDSSTPLNQGQSFFTLSGGSFSSASVNYLPGGTYNIWGYYGGDATHAASSSAKTQITVSPEVSATYFNVVDVATASTNTAAISSGTTGIPYGTQLILDAAPVPASYYSKCIAPSNPPSSCSTTYFAYPTGTVTFADNGSTVNTAVINAEGDAEYNGVWGVGSHSVTAAYSGDASYNSSSASAITFSIVRNSPTFTSLSVYGSSTAFTFEVINSANLNSETQYNVGYSVPAAAPTGTITVSGLPSGVPTTATLSAAVDPNTYSPMGVATVVAPAGTAAGTYSATVTYSGDANYNSFAKSGTLRIVSSTKVVSSVTASYTGSISPTTNVKITGTVTGLSGSGAPTGYVEVYASGNDMGSVTLTPGSGITASFSITLDSQSLPQGANLIDLQYLGDSTYAASVTTLSLANALADFAMVPLATRVTLSAGAVVADTVSIQSVNGLSGSVAVSCAAPTGVTCSVSSPVTLTSGGSASIPVSIGASSSASGTVSLTATSGGYVHTLGIQVTALSSSGSTGFTMGNSGSITVSKGKSGSATISLTPAGGFKGTINWSCSVSSTTTGVGCSVSPAASMITGTAAASTTLSVTTTTSSAANRAPLPWYFALTGGAGLAMVLFSIPAGRRVWRMRLGLLIAVALCVVALGCGGGSSSKSSSTSTSATTSTYTITVAGSSGSFTASTPVALTVTQ